MTNEQIKTVGQTIVQETTIGGNTAARVGGVVEGIGAALDNKDAAIGYFLGTISGGSIYVNAPNYLLGSGGNLKIKMPAAATSACTLTIGNAQAVQLWYNGAAVSSQNTWDAGEIVSVYYDGTRFMASNSQGGAKFSGGQKVSDITLEQALGSGVNSVVSQKGVSDAIFNEIDINDIDDLKNLADALNPSSSLKPTYYTVTAVRGSVTMKVGSMAVISDNIGHVVTEIMSTHYLLDADGYLTDEHNDAEVFTIFRSVKGNGGTLPTPVGTWTAWKYINQSVWPDVASVEQRLLAMMGYYVCDTAAGTADKTVSASGYALTNGGCIRVKMTNVNTADNVTLNINSTGAKALFYDGAQASSANAWEAGEVLEVYYDGTQYQCVSSGGGRANRVKYDNSGSGLSSDNVQGAIDEVLDEVTENENYCKSGVETRFVQGIVSSSNGNIVNASDNITSVFIDGGCIVTAKDGYCIRRVAKYNKTTEAFISGLYASDDYTRMFIYLEDGYKYRFTIYAGGSNISTNDDVLESIKVYSFPYINSVDNPSRFEDIIIRPTGELLTTADNRTFIYRIAFEGQLFVAKYYLDGNFANRGIWIADDENGTNITRKSTAATIGYHSDKYIAVRSDVGKYIFICGKHDPSNGYVLDVGYVSNGVDSAVKDLSDNIDNATIISKSITVNDYLYSGWVTYTNLKWVSESGGSSVVIPVKSAESVSVTAHSSNNSMYVWLKTCSPVRNELLDVSTGSTLKSIIANTTVNLHVPNDAEYIMILGTVGNVDRKPSSVIIHNRVKESFVLEQSAILNGVVPEGQWIKTHAYLSNVNKNFAVGTYTYSKYINVKEGDNLSILADKGYDCEWATLKSIPSLIVQLQLSNSIRFGVVESGKSINLTISKDETILLLNLGNSQYTYDGTVMYSTNHWVSGGNPVICVPVYGQSLAVGGDAPRITNSAKFPLITFNTELLYNKFTDTQETAKFGLLDSYVESLCIDRCIGQGNVGSSIMSFSFGQGSRSIIYLKKGTTLYTQFLAKIQDAYNIVGSSLVVPAFCWIQGEDDRFGDYTDDYKGELAQLREDLDEDIKAITGQTQDVHCIVYQTNQLSIGSAEPGHYVPTSYNSGDYGGLMTVPTAQYELIRDNPYFHAATPIYYMKFATSSNGRTIHINSESQKVMGFYCGLAAERVTEGLADIGLYVQSVTKIDSTHIQLTLHTPCPPIVVDTQQVYEVDGYGFSVITPNNTNILQSVEVKPNHWSEQVINITTSEDCTNAKVRYGCNGVIAGDSDGYARGSRGNIRDSQGLQYFATVNGKNIPMHNWLYFGEWLIS